MKTSSWDEASEIPIMRGEKATRTRIAIVELGKQNRINEYNLKNKQSEKKREKREYNNPIKLKLNKDS